MTIRTGIRARRADLGRRSLAAVALCLAAAGCDPQKDLLGVEDPDIIAPENAQSAEGALGARAGALGRLRTITAGGESTWLLGGLLADEYRSSDTFTERNETDQRSVQTNNGNVNTAYRNIHRARLGADLAIAGLRQFDSVSTAISQVDVAEMYMVRGFAELTSAENFCNGQPFSTFRDNEITYGEPKSSLEALGLALASLDSGLTTLGAGTDARSATLRASLRTLRGRVLLGLDSAAAAGAAVAAVPVTAAYNVTFAPATGDNQIWALQISARRWTLVNAEGGNGLNFVAANDPRVPNCVAATGGACGAAIGQSDIRGFDTQNVPVRIDQLKWPVRDAPATVVGGVEARLIAAESQLRAGQTAAFLETLNALRANTALYPCPAAAAPVSFTNASCSATPTALAPLTDPGTAAARVDLLFRERAFWLFGTGRRLGDLRRLIRQYGRDQATVFPTGVYFKGGVYGTDVNFPVPQTEQNNPNFEACTDRNA